MYFANQNTVSFKLNWFLKMSYQATSNYVSYFKEYPKVIQRVRSLWKVGKFEGFNVDLHSVFHTLGLPLIQLSQYRVYFYPIYDELDIHAQKAISGAIESLENLFQRGQANTNSCSVKIQK